MTKRCFHLTLLGSLFFLHILSMGVHAQVLIWANEGGDKVIQSELRATNDAAGVIPKFMYPPRSSFRRWLAPVRT